MQWQRAAGISFSKFVLQEGEANPLDHYEPVDNEVMEEEEGEDLMENMERCVPMHGHGNVDCRPAYSRNQFLP